MLPLRLIAILEPHVNWNNFNLNRNFEKEAIHLYAKVHQDPVLYKNLYRYLVYRFATPKNLSRVTELLFR